MHHRFFIDFEIGDSQRAELVDKDLLHQLISVFRAKLGDEILLLDNSGFEYSGTIKGISKKEIIVQINNKAEGKKPNIEINLFQSLLKKDNLEFVFEKCTEVGVARFVPVLAEHSIKFNLNNERLRKIVKEASEQCGRAKLPKTEEIMSFEKSVEFAMSDKDAVNFIFHEGRRALIDGARHDSAESKCCDKLSCDFLKNFNSPAGGLKFNLFIGPEGGFSNQEIELAKKNNFYVLSLGDLVLRAETAAIVSSFLVISK